MVSSPQRRAIANLFHRATTGNREQAFNQKQRALAVLWSPPRTKSSPTMSTVESVGAWTATFAPAFFSAASTTAPRCAFPSASFACRLAVRALRPESYSFRGQLSGRVRFWAWCPTLGHIAKARGWSVSGCRCRAENLTNRPCCEKRSAKGIVWRERVRQLQDRCAAEITVVSG